MASKFPFGTVLIVDDEPAILASLRRLLRPEGYNVLTALNGPEGLELMDRHRAQVVVSDGLMKSMTGVEFLLRVREAHPSAVRIMLTGYTHPQATEEAKARCDLFAMLTKPWDDRELLEVIRAAFRQHEDVRRY